MYFNDFKNEMQKLGFKRTGLDDYFKAREAKYLRGDTILTVKIDIDKFVYAVFTKEYTQTEKKQFGGYYGDGIKSLLFLLALPDLYPEKFL